MRALNTSRVISDTKGTNQPSKRPIPRAPLPSRAIPDTRGLISLLQCPLSRAAYSFARESGHQGDSNGACVSEKTRIGLSARIIGHHCDSVGTLVSAHMEQGTGTGDVPGVPHQTPVLATSPTLRRHPMWLDDLNALSGGKDASHAYALGHPGSKHCPNPCKLP